MLNDKLIETEGKTAEEVKKNLNIFYKQALEEVEARKQKTIIVGSVIVGTGLFFTAIAMLSGNSGGMQAFLASIMSINGIAITMTVSTLSEISRRKKSFKYMLRQINEGKIDPFEIMQAAKDVKRRLENRNK